MRLFSLILIALIALSTPALTEEPGPKSFLEGIYKRYQGEGAEGVDPETFNRYFDDSLTKLYEKDRREAGEEVGRLDFDPFVNGQDFEIGAVSIEVTASGDETAKGTASFTNMQTKTTVHYDLVQTSSGWRIQDIRWPEHKQSLRGILSGK